MQALVIIELYSYNKIYLTIRCKGQHRFYYKLQIFLIYSKCFHVNVLFYLIITCINAVEYITVENNSKPITKNIQRYTKIGKLDCDSISLK